ncbi:Sodium/glucose cotransporter 4 [Portunus trituberculatus]|uniref:Sodium/glucose cotransporter 4 n=1 Tax=Portunus trituberculatus TaxID=210409 RepID=A0A5B7FDH0_PORTR|nr:Sodium/glucose cotransporter 4 [Portunus trituberculatus]
MPNSTCGLPRVDSWRMLRDADPSVSDMPWPAFLMGQMPASIWYWCADQVMVQRVMAARSLSHAKGMISRVLFPNEVGCVDPEECYKFCGSRVSCSNSAYPKLVLEYLPSGMRGIMLSVMLSALMSDLTSIFNSASTLFTMDIWSQFRPRAKGREQLMTGRCFIIILVVFSILWIPIIERTQGGQLYIYIQAIAAYLAPPIAAMYCLAITWKRMNESFHYMYFATFLFWVTITVVVVVTLVTPPDEDWRLIRTTFFTRLDRHERKDDVELLNRARAELLLSSPNTPENKYIEHGCQEPEHKIPWYRRFYNWLLGFDDSDKAQQQIVEMNEHIAQLTNLQQEKWENYLLNIMLVVILLVMMGLYIYFSINPFTQEQVHDIQREKLHKLVSMSSWIQSVQFCSKKEQKEQCEGRKDTSDIMHLAKAVAD